MTTANRLFASVALATILCVAGAACSSSSSSSAITTKTKQNPTTTKKSGPTTTLADDGSEFCATVKRLNKNKSLDPATMGKPNGPEKLQQGFTDLESVAPDSLKASIKTVAEALNTIATTKPTNDDELKALNAKISTPEIQKASDELESYTKKHCKVDLGGTP